MRNNVTLINFADEKFKETQDFCSRMARLAGRCDRVIPYTPKDVDRLFYENNRRVLETKRGAGLWLWKPYFIDKTLRELGEGDYLFYCDSGAFFVRNVKSIISSMKQDVWVAELPLIEKQWTKPSCFIRMNADSEEFRESNQIQASFLCIRKTKETVTFIREWLELCCDYDLISPEEGIDNSQGKSVFIAHREDQSILSLLCKMKGIRPHKDPSQFGRYPEGYRQPGYLYRSKTYPQDKYKCTIILHRLPKVKKKAFFKSYLTGIAPKFIADSLYWRHRT